MFQAEQIGLSGVDSDEDASKSALGRGSNVSTNTQQVLLANWAELLAALHGLLENEIMD